MLYVDMFKKTVYILTYDDEQSNRVSSVFSAFDNIVVGIRLHCHRCMLHRNIFRNPRRGLYYYRYWIQVVGFLFIYQKIGNRDFPLYRDLFTVYSQNA